MRQIAWRLQVLEQGDLWERARRRALEIADDADLKTQVPSNWGAGKPARRKRREARLPVAGAVLRRVCRDRTVVVKVLSGGFEYQGQHYGSSVRWPEPPPEPAGTACGSLARSSAERGSGVASPAEAAPHNRRRLVRNARRRMPPAAIP